MATNKTNKTTGMAKEPTMEELLAQLAQAKAENERLRQETANKGKMSVQISAQGGVSVYGLGQWPVTLYREQWERLMNDGIPMVKDLIAKRGKDLAVKGLPYTPPADVQARIDAKAKAKAKAEESQKESKS